MFDGQPPESYSEIRAVERVYERVDGRIDPPQPREVLHDQLVDLVSLDERREKVEYEKGQPAGYEAAHHYAEGLRRLRLPPEGRHSRSRLEVQHGRVQVEGLRPGSQREGRPIQAGRPGWGEGFVGVVEGVVQVGAEGPRLGHGRFLWLVVMVVVVHRFRRMVAEKQNRSDYMDPQK